MLVRKHIELFVSPLGVFFGVSGVMRRKRNQHLFVQVTWTLCGRISLVVR